MTATLTTSLQDRIRAAYAALATRCGQWIGLLELRAELAGVDRAEMDRALRMLGRQEGVVIIPESNQKTLTPADRDAAVVIGDQPKHLISIWD